MVRNEVFFITLLCLLSQNLSSGARSPHKPRSIQDVPSHRIHNTKEQIETFEKDLNTVEKKVNIFVQTMKKNYGKFKFVADNMIREFRAQPNASPKRSTCYCEDQLYSPCPVRCINSCQLVVWGYYQQIFARLDDCVEAQEQWSIVGCNCHYGSSKKCMTEDGNVDVSLCYDDSRGNPNCLERVLDSSKIERSVSLFSRISLEPQKTLVRNLEFNVTSLFEWVETLREVTDDALELCRSDKSMCNTELSDRLEKYLEMIKTKAICISKDMTDIQNQADESFKQLKDMREQILSRMNECASDASVNSEKVTPPESLCDHRRCILKA